MCIAEGLRPIRIVKSSAVEDHSVALGTDIARVAASVAAPVGRGNVAASIVNEPPPSSTDRVPALSSTEIKKDTDTKIEIKLNEGATLDDIKNQIRGLEEAEDIDYTELDDE